MCECARATSEIHFPLFLVLVFHEHFHCAALFPSSAVADCWQTQLLPDLWGTPVEYCCASAVLWMPPHINKRKQKPAKCSFQERAAFLVLPFLCFYQDFLLLAVSQHLVIPERNLKKHQLWTQARLYTAQGVSLADQKSTICNSWTSQRKNFELRLMALLTKTWKVLIKKN